MHNWLAGLALVMIVTTVACAPLSEDDAAHNESYGAGFIEVSTATWSSRYSSVYPFTVANGELVCSVHPRFGRMVYFMPAGFTDESYIGTPLNRAAANSLKQNKISSNVPYNIKKDADLSDAIKAGLQVCDEQQAMLEKGA